MKYVIKNYKTGKYINIDQSSGGYPYQTDIENAKFWYNRKLVLDYIKIFSNEPWELHELVITSELIN